MCAVHTHEAVVSPQTTLAQSGAGRCHSQSCWAAREPERRHGDKEGRRREERSAQVDQTTTHVPGCNQHHQFAPPTNQFATPINQHMHQIVCHIHQPTHPPTSTWGALYTGSVLQCYPSTSESSEQQPSHTLAAWLDTPLVSQLGGHTCCEGTAACYASK